MKYITVFKNSCVHIKKIFPHKTYKFKFCYPHYLQALAGFRCMGKKESQFVVNFLSD